MEVERYRRLSINLQYKDNNMNEQYDFAFSFAGEDRILVEKIKDGLNGFKIFYDEDKQSELCGKDLYNYLRNLYMKRTKYVVCFGFFNSNNIRGRCSFRGHSCLYGIL